jgi:FtsX-like permease family
VAVGPRIVLPRARSQLLILGAAFITVLLATTLLAAVTSYLTAVTDGSLSSTVRSAAPQDVATEVRSEVSAEDYETADSAVRRILLHAYAGVSTPVWNSLVSGSYALPAGVGAAESLTVVSAYDDLDKHATLVIGSWPEASAEPSASSPIEVALPDAAATALGLQPGSVLQLTPRSPGPAREVVVVGLYAVDDASDPFWFGQQLETQGSRQLTFTTYGPMVTSHESFLAYFSAANTFARWRVAIDAARFDDSAVAALRQGLRGLEDELQGSPAVDDDVVLSTELPAFLATVDRSLLVARSTVLVPVVQVVVLAVTALLLTARLLNEHRRTEVALLRARGASTRQLVATSVREGLLLALPAAVLGPVLASVGLRIVERSPVFRDIGLTVDAGLAWAPILVALLAALGCSAALVVPSLRRALTYVESQGQRGRQSRRTTLQRAGVDIALLVVAAIAVWQLRVYESPIQQDASGRLGIDPLLVVAPALALLAGAVLSLRLLPRLSRLGERAAAPARGLSAALGVWEVHRRPLRYAWPTLLLVLAFAVGALSLAFTSTWRLSQRDQAAYRAGSDLRVTAPLRADAVPASELAGEYGELPGVSAVVPVHRARITLGETAELLAIGEASAGDAADVLAFRPDLADTPLRDLLARLREPVDAGGRVVLSGDPAQLTVTASAVSGNAFTGQLSALIQDANAVLTRLPLGSIQAGAGSTAFSAALPAGAAPFQLVALDLTYAMPPQSAQVELRVESIRTDGLGAGPPSATAGTTWESRSPGSDELPVPPVLVDTATADAAGTVSTTFLTGVSPVRESAIVSLRPEPVEERRQLPVLLSSSAAQESGSGMGSTLYVQLGALRAEAVVVGMVDAVPTIDPSSAAVVVDLQSLAAAALESDVEDITPSEYLLLVSGDSGPAAQALTDLRLAGDVVDRAALERVLLRDPLGVGIQGALVLGFLAAAAFAAIGFAVDATVASRERRTEFALLRALGTGTRQLSVFLAVEQAFLVGLGVAAGLVLGIVVAQLVLPLVSITSDASSPVPGVVVVVPWLALTALAAGMAVLLGTVVMLVSRHLRHIGLASALRLGEDR